MRGASAAAMPVAKALRSENRDVASGINPGNTKFGPGHGLNGISDTKNFPAGLKTLWIFFPHFSLKACARPPPTGADRGTPPPKVTFAKVPPPPCARTLRFAGQGHLPWSHVRPRKNGTRRISWGNLKRSRARAATSRRARRERRGGPRYSRTSRCHGLSWRSAKAPIPKTLSNWPPEKRRLPRSYWSVCASLKPIVIRLHPCYAVPSDKERG